jgi:alpha-1,3-rhamnosyltransferase
MVDDIEYKPLCSILCTSYNHEDFIKDCIHGIWNQAYKNIEIIVLDDGSTDKSVSVLNDLNKCSPFPMQIIVQENTGNVGKNCNKMIGLAKGKYIIFISCDDFLTKNSINEKITLMEKDESICLVISKKYYRINKNNTISEEIDQDWLAAKITIDDLLNLEYERFHSFFIQGVVFRKDIVNQVDGFNENMAGDDIVLRTKIFLYLKQNPDKSFVILDTLGFYYRMHDHNIHKNRIRQIKTVVEVLDTFFTDRPTPEILTRWMKNCVRSMGLKKSNIIFTFSDRCIRLKSNVLKLYHVQRLLTICKSLVRKCLKTCNFI